MLAITKRVQFSAAHYYYLPELSAEENEKLFGKCANRNGHGHNYSAEISISGDVRAETGMIMNLRDLKQILEKQILEPLDHKFLNKEVPFFSERLPTTENLCLFIYGAIKKEISNLGLTVEKVKVFESETLYAEYRG